MFVILASHPGRYRTELGAGLEPHETYEYLFCGQPKARYVIAALLRDVKVRVVDETPPERINDIPSKFLEKFPTIEAARVRLRSLVGFRGLDTELRLVA
ncbi:MAG TPA: ferredoxin [Acetobacteraceae bacterium]|jgi:hypothetical protein